MRRIYIMPKDTEVTQEIRDEAIANNCPEITIGIPPILKDKLRFQKLPLIYEEPDIPTIELPPDSTHISTLVAIDVGKNKPAKVKRAWNGKDYFYDCFVTENIKDQYLAGDILIGDYLLVHFDSIGEQIITAKVFKSW